jgi:hypothetical protein
MTLKIYDGLVVYDKCINDTIIMKTGFLFLISFFILSCSVKNEAMYLHVRSKNHFSSTEDGNALYFFQLFNDTVYKLSETGLEPHVFVNIDNKNIPESFFDSKYANIMSLFRKIKIPSYYK